jgi:hypothetical protein
MAATAGTSNLTTDRLGTRGSATRDLPTAVAVASHLPADAAQHLLQAADHALTTAMNDGMRVCALIALAGALAALRWLTPRKNTEQATAGALTSDEHPVLVTK